jgi:hypothetical protein
MMSLIALDNVFSDCCEFLVFPLIEIAEGEHGFPQHFDRAFFRYFFKK